MIEALTLTYIDATLMFPTKYVKVDKCGGRRTGKEGVPLARWPETTGQKGYCQATHPLPA